MKILYQSEKASVTSTLKNPTQIPSFFKKLPFEKIKDDILGKKYELSVVLIGSDRSKKLNFKYRKKDYPTDVLSFEISKESGEIFICPQIAKKKCEDFGMTYPNYLLFLVIHASFHLKGMEHSSKMEKYELAHYSRYRYRNV